jgi:hypothetical protein
MSTALNLEKKNRKKKFKKRNVQKGAVREGGNRTVTLLSYDRLPIWPKAKKAQRHFFFVFFIFTSRESFNGRAFVSPSKNIDFYYATVNVICQLDRCACLFINADISNSRELLQVKWNSISFVDYCRPLAWCLDPSGSSTIRLRSTARVIGFQQSGRKCGDWWYKFTYCWNLLRASERVCVP